MVRIFILMIGLALLGLQAFVQGCRKVEAFVAGTSLLSRSAAFQSSSVPPKVLKSALESGRQPGAPSGRNGGRW